MKIENDAFVSFAAICDELNYIQIALLIEGYIDFLMRQTKIIIIRFQQRLGMEKEFILQVKDTDTQ